MQRWLNRLRIDGRQSRRARHAVTIAAATQPIIERVENRLLLSSSPTAQFQTWDVTAAGQTTVTVTVVYADDVKIDVNSVGGSDITVAKPGEAPLSLHLVSVAPTKNATPAIGTYIFNAPGGTWDAADNGDYQVTLGQNTVFNVTGVGIAGTSTQLSVNVGSTASAGKNGNNGNGNNGNGKEKEKEKDNEDKQVPKVKLTTPKSVRTPGDGAVVTVRYIDDRGIDASTIGVDDVAVASPSGQALKITGVTKEESKEGREFTATYTVQPPGGSWDDSDNGDYLVVVKAEAVQDVSGRAIDTASGWFDVEIKAAAPPPASPPPAPPPPPPVQSPPPPVQSPPPPVQSPPPPVQPPPPPVQPPPVQSPPPPAQSPPPPVQSPPPPAQSPPVSPPPASPPPTSPPGKSPPKSPPPGKSPPKSPPPVSAPPTSPPGKSPPKSPPPGKSPPKSPPPVSAPPTSPPGKSPPKSPPPVSPPPTSPPGKSPPKSPPPAKSPPKSPPASPPPPVVAGPKVTISPPTDISDEGGTSHTIAITYKDLDGVAAASIGVDDIRVTGPAGPLTVTGVTLQGSSTQQTAIYTFAAPGGTWNADDSGDYQVSVDAGQVTDAAGSPIDQARSSFDVRIAARQPVIDPTFSGGSTISSGFVAEAAVTLEDGRLVLAGRQGSLADGNSQTVLKRLNADGSLDTSFGQNGVVVSAAGRNQAYYALTLLADGSLVAAGSSDGDLLVTRHKSNGALDDRFGLSGQQTLDLGSGNDTAFSVAAAPDGGIVAGGTSDGSFAFARFTGTGSVDTFFGARGAALFALGEGNNVIGGLVVQPNGAIVGVGAAGGKAAVLRLLANGSEDVAFANNGALLLEHIDVRTDLGSPDHTLGIALQPDGKILLTNRTGTDFAVARLNPDGTSDTSFGTNGTATIDFGGDDDADAVLVQGSGEILIVGTTTLGGGQLAVAALHPNGSLDTRFAEGGVVTLDAGVQSSGRALHVGTLVLRAFASARGDQVVVGGSDGSANPVSSSSLRRLNVPGTGLVGSFGSVSGRNRTLRFVDGDGTVVQLSLKGGSGQAFYDGSNVDLVLTGTTAQSALKVKATGGDGRVTLRNLQADGGLRSLNARQAAMTGAFWMDGNIGKIVLGTVGGTLAAAGSIGTLQVAGDVASGTVLAGATLGADHTLGGVGINADTYQPASINKLIVGGDASESLFGAGLNRGNSLFLDGDDVVEGGDASWIRTVIIRGSTDAETRFVAGGFGKAKLPGLIDPSQDGRFEVR